jgi:hypothetical protein
MISTARWPAKDPRGHSPAHSRDARPQFLVGSAAYHGELLKLGTDVGQATVEKFSR